MSLKELLGLTEAGKPEPIPLEKYLENWKLFGANAAGRLLKAFGTPKLVDTAKDERLGRIFGNRTITLYPEFRDFFGIEEVIESIALHLKSAADGLVGSRQIQLYYGPPGSGKSSFATRERDLAELEPMYVLAYEDERGELHRSPVWESPLGLFQSQRHQAILSDTYSIPPSRFGMPMSPWAATHLDVFKGDLTRFCVVRVMPSQAQSIGVAKVAPGNSRAGDVSSLIGIGGARPSLDGYAFIGGLNRTTQGLLEIVEMFGANMANLEPLIGATQDRSYASAGIGELPYEGLIIAHANEEPWRRFCTGGQNPALRNRIRDIAFPLCVRVSELEKIYEKYLTGSAFAGVPRTPHALEFFAMVVALSRVHDTSMTRVLAYDGRMPPSGKEKEWDVESLRASARKTAREADMYPEGMNGLFERDAFALLDRVVVHDPAEAGLDELSILAVFRALEEEKGIPSLNGDDSLDDTLESELVPRLADAIEATLKHAFVERHDAVVKSLVEKYFQLADAFNEGQDVKDPHTNDVHGSDWIRGELSKIEKAVGIRVPNDFRAKLIKAVLYHRAEHGESAPAWDALSEELREPFERHAAEHADSGDDDMLDVISFGAKKTKQVQEKHDAFVDRLRNRNFTLRQIRRMVDFYIDRKRRIEANAKR